MRFFCIYEDHEFIWDLFVEDDETMFGSSVAHVLDGVRQVFLDIFGSNVLNAHPHLSVLPTTGAPTTFRKHNLIFLSSKGTYHLQQIYQFAHELCHFMVPGDVCSRFRWFEETLCEMMSWYTLHRINLLRYTRAIPVLTDDQYNSIERYIDDSRNTKQRINGITVSEFIRENLPHLQRDCYDRTANAIIANEIYPLVCEHPGFWKIVPSLNRLNDNMSLPCALSTVFDFSGVQMDIRRLIVDLLCP